MATANGPRARPRCFEDYATGQVFEFGDVIVDEGEVVEFARRYDPQPFHIDAQAAARSPYGGIIASGWHTCAMVMRLMVEHYVAGDAGLGSPGVEALRWLEPVRPGDTLSVRMTVLEARLSRSKPDRGIVRAEAAVLNQHGREVMTMTSTGFVLTRAALEDRRP